MAVLSHGHVKVFTFYSSEIRAQPPGWSTSSSRFGCEVLDVAADHGRHRRLDLLLRRGPEAYRRLDRRGGGGGLFNGGGGGLGRTPRFGIGMWNESLFAFVLAVLHCPC